MGREIRMVPANYEAPQSECKHWPVCDKKNGHFQPMYDESFEKAANEWLADCIAWMNGTHEDFKEYGKEYPYYWMWNSEPPDEKYYRKYKDEEAVWYQLYETVSEGTPVTPPFATKEELVDYLVKYGDFWDQNRGEGGWKIENAEKFVERGWAPSMIVMKYENGAKIQMPKDMDLAVA